MHTRGFRGTAWRGVGSLTVALAVTIGLVAPAHAAVNDTTLVSRASGPNGAPANGQSTESVVSADGRFVAFVSEADNLSAEDNDAVTNVFVRDLQAGTTTFVSRADGVAGAAADADSVGPSISADGRYVAFASTAANLSSEDGDSCPQLWTNPTPCSDIFVRDLQSGTTTLVSRADGATGAASTGDSFVPTIFPDGGHVVFTSFAANLTTDNTGECSMGSETGPFPVPCPNVFVRDLRAGTTRYLTPGLHAMPTMGCRAAVSADVRHVAVETDVSLDPADTGRGDIYVIDLQTGVKTWASRPLAGGAQGDSDCPSMSADGRLVAFVGDNRMIDANSGPSVWDEVFVRNLTTGVTTAVSRAAFEWNLYSSNPSISGDGRFVAFATDKSISPSGEGVYIRDLQTGSGSFVAPIGSSGNADSMGSYTSISENGLRVAFVSGDDTVSTEDDNQFRNVFVRELGATTPTTCASATATADADTWVAQKTPAATNGASPSLAVGSKASANQRTLVHFALPAVPAGCKVTEAILRLNATSATNGRTLQAIALTAPWTEGAVTWNNQPSTTGAAATTASGTGWRQWTVTTQVNAMYTGANHGLLIRDASEGAGKAATQSFGSRESGAPAPQLVVTFGPN